MAREPVLYQVLLYEGTAEFTIQTMDSHWFLFSESPTNISLFPLIFWNKSFGLNLNKITKTQPIRNKSTKKTQTKKIEK